MKRLFCSNFSLLLKKITTIAVIAQSKVKSINVGILNANKKDFMNPDNRKSI